MPAASPLGLIKQLYHFTDRRNIPLIRQLGGLYSLASLTKAGHTVPAAGGNDWSHEADQIAGMDEYVHLCFRSSHPMEYLAKKEGRIEQSIFLNIDPAVLTMTGVMFTPDVSNKSGVQSFPIAEAVSMIDFEVLYTQTDWKDPAIKQRLKQAEKCEILVPLGVPLALIRNLPNG